MDRLLQQLSERLQKAFAGRLVSVVLYGSAAAGDHQERHSDINVLVVLTQVMAGELADAGEIFRWWRGHGNPAPLLISTSELAASADCFAIEFLDIRQRHRILYGEDVVTPLALDTRYHRVQLEHDLRAKLFRLRQKAACLSSEPDLLLRLLSDSLSTFCVLFRHALLVRGQEPPAAKREVVALAARTFALDALPFEQLLDLREGRTK